VCISVCVMLLTPCTFTSYNNKRNLSPNQNIMEICKQITIYIFYQVCCRLVVIVNFIYAFFLLGMLLCNYIRIGDWTSIFIYATELVLNFSFLTVCFKAINFMFQIFFSCSKLY
jgi:hypothetical protein